MNDLARLREEWGWCADYVKAWPLELRASYESESGRIHVVEFALAAWNGSKLFYVVMPRSWGEFASLAPTGLGRLNRGGERTWRPLLYEFHPSGEMRRYGSQNELQWRWGIAIAGTARAAADPEMLDILFTQPIVRADELLREHLSVQQLLDLDAWGCFYVRGEINRLYRVRPGNGFSIVDPVTRDELVSYCFHPDEYMPDADVALATKLLIEQGRDGEEQALSCGRAYPNSAERREPTDDEVAAREIELTIGG